MDDFKIRRADRDRIDAHQDLGACWNRGWLVAQKKLIRAAQDPGLHLLGNGQFGRCFDTGGGIHCSAPRVMETSMRKAFVTALGAAAIGSLAVSTAQAQSAP